jgi:uncharacterized membrane protein YccC
MVEEYMKQFLLQHKPSLYVIRIILGCLVVWFSLDYFSDSKKIWALISVIVVSDPDFDAVRVSAISRIVNTLLGCVTGLLFMYVGGINVYSLVGAIAVSVLISTTFKRYPASWKLAPGTVAIVIVPAITDKEPYAVAIQVALLRTGEILYGCVVAFAIAVILTAIRKRLGEKKDATAADQISVAENKQPGA